MVSDSLNRLQKVGLLPFRHGASAPSLILNV